MNQNLTERVEGSIRFNLAWDSVKKGMDFQEGTIRVRRYLFDYSPEAASTADRNIAQVIPFWMHMSKNIPFQIVNQWRNPAAYVAYARLKQAFANKADVAGAPSWLQEAGGISLGGGNFLNLGLGQDRLDQQLQMLTNDPWRLTKDVNPLLRVPLELRGGRRLYNNVPFSSAPQQVAGGPLKPLAEALLSLTGNLHNQGGQQTTSAKANYALMNLIPLLSQAEHLFPSTDQYKQQQTNSLLRFAGIPIEHFTPQQMRDQKQANQDALFAALKKQRGW
jgi:hypothetical protein